MPTHSIVAYLLFFSLLGVLGWAYAKDRNSRPIGVVLLFILLTLFSGLRFGLGRDFSMYLNAYEYYPNYVSLQFMEPLWQKMYGLFHLFEAGYTTLQLAVAGATVGLAMRAFGKLSLNFIIALVSFVIIYHGYFESMNLMRQVLAMMVVLAFFNWYLEHRYWSFLGALILAVLFHTSAVFMVPLLLITRVKPSRQIMATVLLGSLMVGTPLLNTIIEAAQGVLPERYGNYLLAGKVSAAEKSSGIYLVFLNALTLYFIWQEKKLRRLHEPTGLYTQMLFWGVVIYNCTLSFEVGMRLMFYPLMFIYPLLANSFELDKSERNRLVILLALSLFFLFEVKNLTNPQEPYSKYQTIFHHFSYNPLVW